MCDRLRKDLIMKQLCAVFLVTALALGGAEEKIAPLGTYKPAERNYWAFQPRKKVAPPAVAGVRNPVDAFIADGLRKVGLRSAPAATAPKGRRLEVLPSRVWPFGGLLGSTGVFG